MTLVTVIIICMELKKSLKILTRLIIYIVKTILVILLIAVLNILRDFGNFAVR